MQQGDQEIRSNNPLTEQIIGACIAVHRALGPGLLESAYEHCLARELELSDLSFRRQVPLAIEYRGTEIDCGYRLDFVVRDEVVIELKSVERLDSVHLAQVLTYLKIGHFPIGLLINFNVPSLRLGGIRRLTLRP